MDPDISIQSFNDYISIRGIVELNGEYEKVQLSDDEQNLSTLDLDHIPQTHRKIEKVVDESDNRSTFYHRFPVEISVPSYRVNNLEDVTVGISSFDYELPDSSQLKLMSTIEIYGINEDFVETNYMIDNENPDEDKNLFYEDDEERGLINQTFEEEIDDSFEFEIKDEADMLEQTNEVETFNRFDSPNNAEDDLEDKSSYEGSETQGEEPSEKNRWKKENSQTLSEFFKQNKEDETTPPAKISGEEENDEEETIINEEQNVPKSEPEFEQNQEESIRLKYLSEMFRDDGEHFTKMRLCIVQEEDTLPLIAERYETTTLQIIKQNRLSDETILQGQLLYIPYKKKA